MAHKINIIMDQGSTFIATFKVVYPNNYGIDLTSYSANAWMKKSYTANTHYEFSVNTFSNGVVALTMSANATANIDAGRYFYDLDVADYAGNISRLIEGIVTVTPEVTK